MSASGFYKSFIIGDLRPPVQILSWNIDGVNRSGFRHIESGVYKPTAKIGLVGGFTAQHESGVALSFGSPYVMDSDFYSNTACITINMGEVNSNHASYFNKASGIGHSFKAFNMRFWLHNYTAFSGYSPEVYYKKSSSWLRGHHIESLTPGANPIPLSMPSEQNIFVKGSTVFINGEYKDAEFSDFIYLSILFPSGNYILGTYGGLGSGNFRFKLSYDWTDASANVLSTDSE